MNKVNTNTQKKRFYQKFKRQLVFKHLWLTRVIIIFLITAIISLSIILFWLLVIQTSYGKYMNLAKSFVFAPVNQLQSKNGRTNILLLGKAGTGTPSPDLTDTMMLVSIRNKYPNEVTIISIPRDIWVPELHAKINSAYFWGKEKTENGGLVMSKSTVEEVVGVPIHYAIVVDFSGFKDIIDVINGIDVNVERSFTDNWFPIPGKENDLCDGDPQYHCRYETISFEKGTAHMDGETALKFARSRHSEDLTEGTDIARSQRQQKIIEAIKNKILSHEIMFSPKKLKKVIDLTWQIIETDIPENSLAIIGRKIYDSRENINTHVLSEDNFLVNPPYLPQYDNQYVFLPKSGNWDDVHSWVNSILSN